MDQRSFRRTVLLLSGEHSLSILQAMRDGEWHLSSELARSLDIHVTTASRFLHGLADVGLVERRARDERVFEYRLPSPRMEFSVDLLGDTGPLREAIDFYVSYFQSLFERIRRLGWPNVETEMQHRLTRDHMELRSAIFHEMITGGQGGVERLRDLIAILHRDLWSVCSETLGHSAAEKVFKTALLEAVHSHPDIATRCGLTRPLEA